MIKKLHSHVLWFLFGVIFITSCDLTDNGPYPNGRVDIYLLKSWQLKANSFQIQEKDIEMEVEPLVSYNELLQYDQKEYAFKLSESARQRINNLESFGHGKPFAVTVNDSVVYTGYFWASFSSALCDWVIIDPLTISSDEWMRVSLGYPWQMPDFNIPDKRNDQSILQVFKADKKLKK
jgi:hypothetical protein